jgi:hypothetical protein
MKIKELIFNLEMNRIFNHTQLSLVSCAHLSSVTIGKYLSLCGVHARMF